MLSAVVESPYNGMHCHITPFRGATSFAIAHLPLHTQEQYEFALTALVEETQSLLRGNKR